MLRQSLQQKQQLKLTPQQMLVQKLVQLPVTSIEQRIKEEIENNPALEEAVEGLNGMLRMSRKLVLTVKQKQPAKAGMSMMMPRNLWKRATSMFLRIS